MILDGTVIPCDRCKEPALSIKGEVIDLWYSGKAHSHGGNIQAVLAPGGFPLWVSQVEPGSAHDITAARLHALPALYRAAVQGLPTLADPGYEGAGIGIHIPVKQPAGGLDLDINTRTRKAIQRSLRCLGERGFALLTGRWRTLQHITASPSQNRRHRPRRTRPDPFWLCRSVLTPVIGKSRIQLLINKRCFVGGSWIRLLGAALPRSRDCGCPPSRVKVVRPQAPPAGAPP